MPKVFIIIVNWNGWKDTIECLKSLEQINYPDFEVVLVDNGSKEKLKIKNEKLKITQIFNEKNLGFAGGNNVGIKLALEKGADYILLLNNDTVVDPMFLDELIRVGESNKNSSGEIVESVGILGPKIYYFDDPLRQTSAHWARLASGERQGKPNRIWSAGGKISWGWFGGNTHLKFNKLENNVTTPDVVTLVEYVSGCAMLVKREVFEKIGLLYEPYFLYYEDVDFCLRAAKVGYQCAMAPTAKIWHKVSASTKTLGNPVLHYYNHRNILLLAKRNRPIFFYFVMVPWSIWKLAKQLLKLIIKSQTKLISLAIIRGIIDFYKGKFGQKQN